MTTQPIARLDRTQPPPGYSKPRACGFEDGTFYVVAAPCGVSWRGEHVAEVVAAAWAHYEREHDPPGLEVRTLGAGWAVSLRGIIDPGPGIRTVITGPTPWTMAEARAAAWVWYWRRVAVANDLDNLSIRDFAGTPRGCVTRWPECLVWLDEQVFTVERWISNGGDTPEVLCA